MFIIHQLSRSSQQQRRSRFATLRHRGGANDVQSSGTSEFGRNFVRVFKVVPFTDRLGTFAQSFTCGWQDFFDLIGACPARAAYVWDLSLDFGSARIVGVNVSQQYNFLVARVQSCAHAAPCAFTGQNCDVPLSAAHVFFLSGP